MNFHEMTRDQLRKLAAEANIRGRSKMTKAELAEALEYTHIGEPELQVSETEENTPEEEAAFKAWFDAKVAEQQAAVPPEPQDTDIKALVTRDAPGSAYVNLETSSINTAGIMRKGRRFELVSDTGVTIRARSIAKVVKAWAKHLNVMLDGIETVRQF